MPSSSVPNWFVALPVPSGPFLTRLAPPPGVSRFAPDDLHLTVAFLGPCTADAAARAFAAAWPFPLAPIDVTLAALEPLGRPARPSAFSALLGAGRAEVERAMGSVRGACYAAAGSAGDTRPPLAHVTLARPLRSLRAEALASAVAWARSVDLGAPMVRLSELALYTRSERPAEARFRIVARRALTG